MDPQDVARRIRMARASTGKNQIEFGELVGVSDSTIARWEKGQKVPSEAELYLLAERVSMPRRFFTAPWAEIMLDATGRGEGGGVPDAGGPPGPREGEPTAPAQPDEKPETGT